MPHTLRRTLTAASAVAVALVAAAVIGHARSALSSSAWHGRTEDAVLPHSFVSRNMTDIFNAPAAPAYQLQHHSGAALLGDTPTALLLVEERGYAFAHEAPVWFADTDDVYFASNAGAPLGRSNLTTNNVVFRVNLRNLTERAAAGAASFASDVQAVSINSDSVQMTNGGTPYAGELLLISTGRGSLPGSIALVPRSAPQRPQVLLNNFRGRGFKSLNDVVVHPSGSILFTDADYGVLQDFKDETGMWKAVWRFEPHSGDLTVLDASLTTPNGLVLSPDARTLYVTETGFARGFYPTDPTIPPLIYAFDLSASAKHATNRRVFAVAESGIADGLKVDMQGNVYSCDGTGLQVYSPSGTQLWRFVLPPMGCTQVVLAGGGRIVVLAEERLFLLQVAAAAPVPLAELPHRNRVAAS